MHLDTKVYVYGGGTPSKSNRRKVWTFEVENAAGSITENPPYLILDSFKQEEWLPVSRSWQVFEEVRRRSTRTKKQIHEVAIPQAVAKQAKQQLADMMLGMIFKRPVKPKDPEQQELPTEIEPMGETEEGVSTDE